MKLAGAKANNYFAKPDPTHCAILIYGADGMRVALKRQELLKSLVGESAEEEMRLTRLSGSDLRSDPAIVLDGLKAQGFFPGPRAVFIEDVSDAHAVILTTAISEWLDGDATLVVSAGSLAAKSKLRKAFESGSNTVSIGIYNDPPNPDMIMASAQAAGLNNFERTAKEAFIGLGRDLDPGDLAQFIEKLSLYKIGDDTSVTVEDIENCAPQSIDVELDEVLHIMAEARAPEVGPVLKRLFGQGINPTTLCISATRHFRTLHSAASHPQGPDTGIMRARPPVFGPRKDRMVRQARNWGMARLERALSVLLDTDLALRSSQKAPDMALLERAFIRISMLRPK